MSGVLGTHDLTGGVTQSIYQCDTDQFTTANISLCNRHNVDVKVTLAITDSENAFDDARYVEYETILKPKGVLERTAVVVPTEKYITVLSSHNAVSAVAWGIRAGDDISVSAITDATDAVAPTFIINSVAFTPGELTETQLETNEVGNVTFALTSGTLPSGLTLRSDGFITGTTDSNDYGIYDVTVTATDESGNNTANTISIGPGSKAVTVSGDLTKIFIGSGSTPGYISAEHNVTLAGYGYNDITWVPDEDITCDIYCWGAGGGGTRRTAAVTGGPGGFASGRYTFTSGTTYKFVVGGAGEAGDETPATNTVYNAAATGGGTAGGNSSGTGDGGGGGGYTGIFETSVAVGNAIIVAGAGGGGSGDTAYGGGGGGNTGGDGSNGTRGGDGGTQGAGGAAGTDGNAGTAGGALQGGNGGAGGGTTEGAGGGGGYYGGGGGGSTGGGGSGYIGAAGLTNGVTTQSGTNTSPAGSTQDFYISGVAVGGNLSRGGGGLLVLVEV
jgi:hypothetical protein